MSGKESTSVDNSIKQEYTTVFVAYITTKKGKRIYAHQLGLKAFPLKVKSSRT